jgi:hypothetical protein
MRRSFRSHNSAIGLNGESTTWGSWFYEVKGVGFGSPGQKGLVSKPPPDSPPLEKSSFIRHFDPSRGKRVIMLTRKR